VPRRQIPLHESMLNPRRPGILESIGERLGVSAPPDPAELENPLSVDAPAQETGEGTTQQSTPIGAAPEPASASALPPVRSSTRPRSPARDNTRDAPPNKREPAPVEIDPRIVASKSKQALYLRLPREMHEFLADLSYRLSKINRDASMTNLVAQAIADKYPTSLDPVEETD